MSRLYLVALSILFVLVGGACTPLYQTGGLVVHDLTDRHVTPYTMSIDDVEVACETTLGLQPMVMAFTRVHLTPERAALIMNMMTGACAEMKAAEEGLAYLRHFKAQNANEAKDARIREKRQYALAAARQYRAWQYMEEEFGPAGDGCPFWMNKMDGVYWAMGNIAGVLAVFSDLKSQTQVQVPKDIAMQAVRGLQCLKNEKYWGVPAAAQAGMWVLFPDTAPEGVDPWEEFKKSSTIGSEAGVRLSHAFEVIIADGSGDVDRLKDAIRRHADSLDEYQPSEEFQLLDVMASLIIKGISDRMWTEGTGSRTPVGEFGTFWDDKKENALNVDIDDLLDDL